MAASFYLFQEPFVEQTTGVKLMESGKKTMKFKRPEMTSFFPNNMKHIKYTGILVIT